VGEVLQPRNWHLAVAGCLAAAAPPMTVSVSSNAIDVTRPKPRIDSSVSLHLE